MAKEPENKIDLDTSVSEQIADMQLMYLRQAAFNRVLSYDEIKTLEITSDSKIECFGIRELTKEHLCDG